MAGTIEAESPAASVARSASVGRSPSPLPRAFVEAKPVSRWGQGLASREAGPHCFYIHLMFVEPQGAHVVSINQPGPLRNMLCSVSDRVRLHRWKETK